MTSNDKPLYIFTYVDLILYSENTVSYYFLKLIENPKFKTTLKSVSLSIIVITSYFLF